MFSNGVAAHTRRYLGAAGVARGGWRVRLPRPGPVAAEWTARALLGAR